jgi:hypothetical protein
MGESYSTLQVRVWVVEVLEILVGSNPRTHALPRGQYMR